MPLWPPQDMAGYRGSFLTTELMAEYDPLLGWRQRTNPPVNRRNKKR